MKSACVVGPVCTRRSSKRTPQERADKRDESEVPTWCSYSHWCFLVGSLTPITADVKRVLLASFRLESKIPRRLLRRCPRRRSSFHGPRSGLPFGLLVGVRSSGGFLLLGPSVALERLRVAVEAVLELGLEGVRPLVDQLLDLAHGVEDGRVQHEGLAHALHRARAVQVGRGAERVCGAHEQVDVVHVPAQHLERFAARLHKEPPSVVEHESVSERRRDGKLGRVDGGAVPEQHAEVDVQQAPDAGVDEDVVGVAVADAQHPGRDVRAGCAGHEARHDASGDVFRLQIGQCLAALDDLDGAEGFFDAVDRRGAQRQAAVGLRVHGLGGHAQLVARPNPVDEAEELQARGVASQVVAGLEDDVRHDEVGLLRAAALSLLAQQAG
eukprot:scaffold1085_cov252-Pinguiococcus_pyrenoidosus.AAC.6